MKKARQLETLGSYEYLYDPMEDNDIDCRNARWKWHKALFAAGFDNNMNDISGGRTFRLVGSIERDADGMGPETPEWERHNEVDTLMTETESANSWTYDVEWWSRDYRTIANGIRKAILKREAELTIL